MAFIVQGEYIIHTPRTLHNCRLAKSQELQAPPIFSYYSLIGAD